MPLSEIGAYSVAAERLNWLWVFSWANRLKLVTGKHRGYVNLRKMPYESDDEHTARINEWMTMPERFDNSTIEALNHLREIIPTHVDAINTALEIYSAPENTHSQYVPEYDAALRQLRIDTGIYNESSPESIMGLLNTLQEVSWSGAQWDVDGLDKQWHTIIAIRDLMHDTGPYEIKPRARFHQMAHTFYLGVNHDEPFYQLVEEDDGYKRGQWSAWHMYYVRALGGMISLREFK